MMKYFEKYIVITTTRYDKESELVEKAEYILNKELNKYGINITDLEGNDIEINVYNKKYTVKNSEYIANKNVVLS